MAICNALTQRKTRCKNTAKQRGYCTMHSNIINKGVHVLDYVEPVAVVAADAADVAADAEDEPEAVVEAADVEPEAVVDAKPARPVKAEPVISKPIELVQTVLVHTVSVPTVECRICYTDVLESDAIHCGVSKHVACTDCTKAYIQNLIESKKQCVCMFDSIEHCHKVYDDVILGRVFDTDTALYAKYLDYQQVDSAAKIASAVSNYHICPFCSKWGIIVDNMYPGNHPQNIINVDCGNCGVLFCILCRKAYHGKDSCNKIDHVIPTETVIRNTINRVIDDAVIHSCPKCYTKYSKEDGCNLMTCPSCNTYSCYLCNMVLVPKNGQKYWHFSSEPGKCNLYNHKGMPTDRETSKSNVAYNNTKIVNALKRLLLENMDNSQVKSMLLADIRKRGYRIIA